MTRLAARIKAANLALFTHGDLEVIAEFFSPEYVVHLTDREMFGGHEAIRSVATLYQRAFAEMEVQVEILVEGKDRVAWQRRVRGTHRAAFRGFPPSGREVVWRDMVVSRFHAGLIAEEWLVTDLAERLLLARKH